MRFLLTLLLLSFSFFSHSTELFPTDAKYRWSYEVLLKNINDSGDTLRGKAYLETKEIKSQNELELVFYDNFFGDPVFPKITTFNGEVKFSGVTHLLLGGDKVFDFSAHLINLPFSTERIDSGEWISRGKEWQEVDVMGNVEQAFRLSFIGTYQNYYTAVGDYWLTPGKGIVAAAYTIPGWHVEMRLNHLDKVR